MKVKMTFFLYFFVFMSVYGQNRKIKVACIGNSVTYGYLLPDRENNCYPVKLNNLLGDKYEVQNFGKSGSTLLSNGHRPYIEQEEYINALKYNSDIVIIHLGLNDTDPRNWPNYKDEFFRDYINLIESFKQNNENIQIWICRLSPITNKHPRFISGTRDWHRQIQEQIEQIANYANVGIIDLEQPLINRIDLLPDSLHPTSEGAEIIAETVYSALTGIYGGLKMSPIYSDNMVLQCDIPLNINGIANANEEILVQKDTGEIFKTTTNTNGKWAISLPPLVAGEKFTLKISSPTCLLEFRNVIGGEVWLCSGQSNMAFNLINDENYNEIKNTLNNEDIRFFNMNPRRETYAVEWDKEFLDSLNRLEYFDMGGWQISNDKTAPYFSAIAYYFGKMLSDSLKVPIGLINNSVGGSPLESWIDRRTLETEFPEILNDWTKNDLIMDWVRDRAKLNVAKTEKSDQRHPYEPSYLFASGIEPLKSFPLKGVIWYQGESNANNKEVYEKQFPLFVESWRKNWNNEDLPIYYVQLSSINRPSWPSFRDSQRMMMNEILNTYMVVSSDRGDSLDVHPIFKKDIGERLGKFALNKTYNKFYIVPSGPLFKSVDFEDNMALISFEYGDGLSSSDYGEIKGFEIAEVDGLYYPARVEVERDKLKVWSDYISKPQFVRYAWQPFTRANLVNNANLPASTFKTNKKNIEKTMKNEIQKLPNYPIIDGISAPFVGVSNNILIVGGGCNFPDKLATEGGIKKFYDDIFFLDTTNPSNNWVKGTSFPYKVAYCAYVTTEEGIVSIGGQNEKSLLNKVRRVSFQEKNKNVKIENLPNLPLGVFNAGATIIDRTIYLAGGLTSIGKNTDIFSLDLDNITKGWNKISTNQEYERQQPVVFSQDNKLFMAGGYDEKNAMVFTDVLQFDFSSNKWVKFKDILIDGKIGTFIGTGCANIGSSTTLFVGGVNYDIFKSALQRIEKMQEAKLNNNIELEEKLKIEGKEYMSQPDDWYKFSSTLLSLETETKQWLSLGKFKQISKAGAGITIHNNILYNICGELKPGKRTNEVYKIIIE